MTKRLVTTEEIEQEIARLTVLRDRNEEKRWAAETPNRSRFTYAAHVTKLNGRIGQLEQRLARRAY